MLKSTVIKAFCVSLALITVLSFTVLPGSVASASGIKPITLKVGRQQLADDGHFCVPVRIKGTVSAVSIVVTNAKLKLTSVSDSGYTFENGVVSSTEGDAVPNTHTKYISVQIRVDSAAAAQRALSTVRYCNVNTDAEVEFSASSSVLAAGDYYLNGHYYTLSSSGSMSWKEAMEWAFNLQTTDATRYPGFKSYPVVITSPEENQMMVNIWDHNGASTKRQVFLPAVPANPQYGSIAVEGTEGNRTVTVTDEPVCSDIIISEVGDTYTHGHGENYVWLDGTPSAGETLPDESDTAPAERVYWATRNPENGGMVYFGHPYLGAYWDDLQPGSKWAVSNVWTQPLTKSDGTVSFKDHIYALAEWESSVSDTNVRAKSVLLRTLPETGDAAPVALWLALLMLSLGGVAVLLPRLGKKH